MYDLSKWPSAQCVGVAIMGVGGRQSLLFYDSAAMRCQCARTMGGFTNAAGQLAITFVE
jgi:hypothetical protein